MKNNIMEFAIACSIGILTKKFTNRLQTNEIKERGIPYDLHRYDAKSHETLF